MSAVSEGAGMVGVDGDLGRKRAWVCGGGGVGCGGTVGVGGHFTGSSVQTCAERRY